ncbi:MAG: FAD-dependent oxidoreductase, partial [Acidimicrobiales bacterium]|nr:FAD-dependent oxidoreductase [Acidimicrobiales bacterium]
MIAVIGAGPAGLALAWRLTRAGHDVVVLESSAHVGGMAGSRTISGQRVDLGSHRLHPGMPDEIRAAVDELVEVQERPRNGRIRLEGRWVPFPLTPTGLVRGLSAPTAIGAAVDAATSGFRSPDTDTYAEVVRAGLGATVWEAFHAPFAWKVWGTDPDELSGELARRRISASTPGDVARRLVRNVRATPTFLYPRRGFGALSESMAEL